MFVAPGRHPALYGDMLLTEPVGGSGTGDGVSGYDRHGVRNCGGTPVVSAPIYIAAPEQLGNPATYTHGFVVVGSTLLMLEDYDDEGDSRFVDTYDLDGRRGCRPVDGVPFCFGMWSVPLGGGGNSVDLGRVAAADGLAFSARTTTAGRPCSRSTRWASSGPRPATTRETRSRPTGWCGSAANG